MNARICVLVAMVVGALAGCQRDSSSITTYTPEARVTAQQLRDTYLVLFRNTGDGWKVYREVASAAPPPSGWPAN